MKPDGKPFRIDRPARAVSQPSARAPASRALRIGQVAQVSDSPSAPSTSGPPQDPRRQRPVSMTPIDIASMIRAKAARVRRDERHGVGTSDTSKSSSRLHGAGGDLGELLLALPDEQQRGEIVLLRESQRVPPGQHQQSGGQAVGGRTALVQNGGRGQLVMDRATDPRIDDVGEALAGDEYGSSGSRRSSPSLRRRAAGCAAADRRPSGSSRIGSARRRSSRRPRSAVVRRCGADLAADLDHEGRRGPRPGEECSRGGRRHGLWRFAERSR